MTLDELRQRLVDIGTRLNEINTEFAGQRFSDEAKAEWNTLKAEQVDTRATVSELEVRERELAALADDTARHEAGAPFQVARPGSLRNSDIYDLSEYRAQSSSPEQEIALLRDGAMRSIEVAQFPHPNANREDVQGHVERLLAKHSGDGGELSRRILATGSPTYSRAFGKAALGQPLTDVEARALSTTGTAGGFAVPVTLDPTIIPTSNYVVNPLRGISRIETISGSNTWKAVTSGAVVASRDAENSEVSDDSPTLAQPSVTVTKASAFVPFSDEIGSDWGRLQSEMAKLIQDAKDTEEATSFVTGAGTGVNPQGVITGATGTVAAGTAAFAVAHLYALQEALPPRFRPNAKFLATNQQYNRIRQFDTSGGASLWLFLKDGLNLDRIGNTGLNLLGSPAYEVSTMATALTAGSAVMVFGDFSYFVIVDRLGMDISLVPHLFGATNQRPIGNGGLYANWRNSSQVLSAAAFKVSQTT